MPAAGGIAGQYFDGHTSRAHEVIFSVDAGIATLAGQIDVQCPVAALRVSQRVRHGVRRITFPDHATLETRDLAGLEAILAAHGFQDGLVVAAEHNPRAILVALLLTIVTLGGAYRFGIPAAAKAIAFSLPASAEQAVGNDALRILDAHWFAPSALPAAQRDGIAERFKALTAYRTGMPDYRIVFRKSRIGPNAFALPSGMIVLTDELVRLGGTDDAIMGVLGHELGHLRQRHMMRRLLQSSATAALATLLVGDVSAVAANLPTVLLDATYSRDAEREADDEAVALLKANGIPLEPFAETFARIARIAPGTSSYLSTHPAPDERIARIRAGR